MTYISPSFSLSVTWPSYFENNLTHFCWKPCKEELPFILRLLGEFCTNFVSVLSLCCMQCTFYWYKGISREYVKPIYFQICLSPTKSCIRNTKTIHLSLRNTAHRQRQRMWFRMIRGSCVSLRHSKQTKSLWLVLADQMTRNIVLSSVDVESLLKF